MRAPAYFVETDVDGKGRPDAYVVMFFADGANIEVEDGRFPVHALGAANALRDRLNREHEATLYQYKRVDKASVDL